MRHHRVLCWAPNTEEQLKALKIDYKQFDRVMEAIDEVLSQYPEAFPVIPGTRLSFCRTNEFVGASFPGVPYLAIYFYYAETIVHIISVEESSAEAFGEQI